MNKNILTITFVVLFSITLWIFVSLERDYPSTIKTEIAFRSVPEDLIVGSKSAEEVSIDLWGQGWQLASLAFSGQNKFYIVAGENTGSNTVSTRENIPQNPWIPTTVQVRAIQPFEVTFNLEKTLRKKVPVIANVSLDFNPEFGLISPIKITPDSVWVTGPESQIRILQFAETVYSEYDNLKEKSSGLVQIRKMPNMIYSHDECMLEFDVQKIVDITFDDILVQTIDLPDDKRLQLFPDRIRVILRGGINIISKLNSSAVSAYISFKDAEKDTLGALVPELIIPDQTTLIDSRPNKLKYIIKRF